MQIALYEPDIPQNTGTILRLGACLGVPVHIVGPAAFDSSERNFRRAGLDYLDQVELINHVSFATFDAWRPHQRPTEDLPKVVEEQMPPEFGALNDARVDVWTDG